MATGLQWTNFDFAERYEPFKESSSLARTRRMLLTTSGLESLCPPYLWQYGNLTWSEQLACAAAEKKEETCYSSENACRMQLFNFLFWMFLLFALAIGLHISLMVTWRRVPRLTTIPYPPVLAFPNVELLFIFFSFTGVSTKCAALVGVGTPSAIAIGGGVWLVLGGGALYLMYTASSLASQRKLGTVFEEEVSEVGMDADPLTRCCFPGKNRHSGAWKPDDRTDELEERNERLLSMRMGLRATYHVFVCRGSKLVGDGPSTPGASSPGDRAALNLGDNYNRARRDSGGGSRRSTSGGLSPGKASDTLHVDQVDGLARFGFCFLEFRGGRFTQHYQTIMLLVRGLIVMPAAFVASTEYRNDANVNTIVVAIPFSVLFLQLLQLLICRPYTDRLQWVLITLMTAIECLAFAVQVFDVCDTPVFNVISTEVLVFLLLCSKMGVQMIVKMYTTIFELIIALRQLYYVFMSKLVFEKADFELDAAQASTFIVVKDGVGVGSAVNEFSRQMRKNNGRKDGGGWWTRGKESTSTGTDRLRKVQIAPEPAHMRR